VTRHALTLALCLAFLFPAAGSGQERNDRPPLNPVGLTGLSWGAWVQPETKMEDWVRMARALCQGEEFCKFNVFDGPELATHLDPVPEENRKALKYVFTYQEGETPSVVVREARPEEGREPREWTFD